MYQTYIKEESGAWGLDFFGSEDAVDVTESGAVHTCRVLTDLWPGAVFGYAETTTDGEAVGFLTVPRH